MKKYLIYFLSFSMIFLSACKSNNIKDKPLIAMSEVEVVENINSNSQNLKVNEYFDLIKSEVEPADLYAFLHKNRFRLSKYDADIMMSYITDKQYEYMDVYKAYIEELVSLKKLNSVSLISNDTLYFINVTDTSVLRDLQRIVDGGFKVTISRNKDVDISIDFSQNLKYLDYLSDDFKGAIRILASSQMHSINETPIKVTDIKNLSDRIAQLDNILFSDNEIVKLKPLKVLYLKYIDIYLDGIRHSEDPKEVSYRYIYSYRSFCNDNQNSITTKNLRGLLNAVEDNLYQITSNLELYIQSVYSSLKSEIEKK